MVLISATMQGRRGEVFLDPSRMKFPDRGATGDVRIAVLVGERKKKKFAQYVPLANLDDVIQQKVRLARTAWEKEQREVVA